MVTKRQVKEYPTKHKQYKENKPESEVEQNLEHEGQVRGNRQNRHQG